MFTKILNDFICYEFLTFNSKLQKIKIQDLNIKINKKGINIFLEAKSEKTFKMYYQAESNKKIYCN
jgi:hypothetical protein